MIRLCLSRKLGDLRITQSELARVTGIRPNTINEIYHDVAERVSLDDLDKICEALECELAEIVEFIPNTTRTVQTCQRQSIYKSK